MAKIIRGATKDLLSPPMIDTNEHKRKKAMEPRDLLDVKTLADAKANSTNVNPI
jgi:hypothetical protein